MNWRNLFRFLTVAFAFGMFASLAAAQLNPTGTLNGTVLDPSGAVIAGATIDIKDSETGSAIQAKSDAAGRFTFANLQPGDFTVTVTASNFQTGVFKNVKVVVGQIYDLKATLQIGQVSSQVVVEAGEQVIETTQTEIGSSVSGPEITHTPSSSNSALWGLAIIQPEIQTIGGPRQSSAEGLPGGAVNITFDGIAAQWQSGKSGDPIFTMIYPNIDDVAEFNITSAAGNVGETGEGAVQINMVSQRGTNAFHGGVWEYFRNDYLNANYYFNNLASQPRQKMRYDQYGGKIGGPIWKKKIHFFVDFTDWNRPQSVTRTRTILNPQAATGIYTYTPTTLPTAGQLVNTPWVTCNGNAAAPQCSANLMQMAGHYGATSTVDTLVGSALSAIQSATTAPGVTSLGALSLYQNQIDFTNSGVYELRMPDVRLDFQISKNHSFEADYHLTRFNLSPDILNAGDSTYPVAPFNQNEVGYVSDRQIFAFAERWNIGSSASNEIRFGFQASPEWFAGNFNSSIYPVAQTNMGSAIIEPVLPSGLMDSPWLLNTPSSDNPAVGQLSDNFSWTKGRHSMSFGFTLTRQLFKDANDSPAFAQVALGLSGTDPMLVQFADTNLPNMGSFDLSTSAQLYGMLAGRITSYSGSVALDPSTRQFTSGVPKRDKYHETDFGLYVSDSWRVRPNLTVNYGLRWQYEGVPVDDLNEYFNLQGGAGSIYGISGAGNLFKPGVMTGSIPTYTLDNGAAWYKNWDKGFAPSLGVAWQPNFENSFAKKMFGESGSTVIRAGYSIAYSREGLNNWLGPDNPGNSGFQFSNPVASSPAPGQFTAGTLQLQSLNIPTVAQNPTSFSPSFQLDPTTGDSVFATDPNLHMPYVQSWSLGVQRSLGPDMALEVRYVGNHGVGLWEEENLNEVNIFENGFLAEFQNAANNLNICETNMGACLTAGAPAGGSFGDFGLPGQRPLPIFTAAFTGSSNSSPGSPTQLSPNFSSGAFVTPLMTGQAGSAATSLTSFSFWQNLVAAGYPDNFWMANPEATGGAYLLKNGFQSTYNALVIDFRRRPAKGLSFDANYTFSKALTDDWQRNGSNAPENFVSLRDTAIMKGPSPYDTRDAIKVITTYDLPFGAGRRWDFHNGTENRIFGGWSINTVVRWQTGRPTLLVGGLGGTVNQYDGGVQLTGLTPSQLQSDLGVYKTTTPAPGAVWYVPQSLLGAGGLGTNPAELAACGTAGSYCDRVFVYGPQFFNADISLQKTTKITERVSIELRAEMLDAFNNANFLWGDAYNASGYSAGASFFSTVTGNLQNPGFGRIQTAYQDLDTTDSPGGRVLQLVFRLNF